MTSTRSAPLSLCIWSVLLPFFTGCSGEEPETPVGDAAASEEEAEAPDPAEALERLRGLVSPAEFERFEEDRGLALSGGGATPGLTLLMPLNSTSIHLVDEAGEIEHTWETDFAPGGWAYLMEDGTLYRSGRADDDQSLHNSRNPGAAATAAAEHSRMSVSTRKILLLPRRSAEFAYG